MVNYQFIADQRGADHCREDCSWTLSGRCFHGRAARWGLQSAQKFREENRK